MSVSIALVVPEYRTDVAPGGGVYTVAAFVRSALSSVPNWTIEVVSPRMWRSAAESQRLGSLRSLLRGPQASVREVNGARVTYVGSHLAEIEWFRFRSRRILRELLSSFDLVFVIAGTPATFETVRGVHVPILAQVATTIKVERARLIKEGNLLRRSHTGLNRLLTYRMDRSGVQLPDLILTENPWMEDWCRTHGAKDVRTELPGVDTDFFSPAKEEPVASRVGYILSVGRLNDPRKNFGLLLRAYARAVRFHGIKQRLVIAGRSDLPMELYQTLERLDVGARVEVRNNLDRNQLREAYRGADLFAMSSSEEGLGMVLVEALACGTPIISTATEGAKSVVTTANTGLLVDLNDTVEKGLADAIAKLANDPEERTKRSEQSRQAAVAHFSMQSAGERFREAVASLL